MHAGVDDFDREPGRAIANDHALLLPIIERRHPKDLIGAPKSALRQTFESNAPAGTWRAEPNCRHKSIADSAQNASLHMWVEEVAEHWISEAIERKHGKPRRWRDLVCRPHPAKSSRCMPVRPARPRRILPRLASSLSNLALSALKICCRLKVVPPLSCAGTLGR